MSKQCLFVKIMKFLSKFVIFVHTYVLYLRVIKELNIGGVRGVMVIVVGKWTR